MQLKKYRRNHSFDIMDFKIQTSFPWNPHDFFDDSSLELVENGVDHTNDESGVSTFVMLVQNNEILNVEMAFIILQVDIFAHN